MITLIGGPPRCGKTMAARRIAALTGAVYQSGDWIEGMVSKYVPQTLKDTLFPKNALRNRTDGSNDVLYRECSAQVIVEAYRNQAETTRPALDELVRRAVSTRTALVIEGFQVTPSLMRDAMEQYGGDIPVVTRLFVRHSVDETVRDCRLSTARNDWFLQKSTDPEVHMLIARMILHYGHLLRIEARGTDVGVIEIANDFLATIDRTVTDMVHETAL